MRHLSSLTQLNIRPLSKPLPYKGRGFDSPPFPSREGGWGVRCILYFLTSTYLKHWLLGAFCLLPLVLPAGSASAQAAYGSYIGVGPTVGVLTDSTGEGRQVGGTIAVRYKLVKAPFSIRTQALVGASSAVVPTVSYDLPLNWQTDIYLGVGVAFAGGDTPSPVGNKTSFALQPGIDYTVPNSNTVIFGNAIIAFDAYRNGGGTALSVQGGLGWKF